MTNMTNGGADVHLSSAEPWFRARPRLALGISIALYAIVFVLRLAVDGADEAVTTLYVLPVALIAFAFGLRAGLAAGVAAVGLIVLWVLYADVSLSPLAWSARIVPLILLGVLVGQSTDRLAQASELERHLFEAELSQREAAEINDSIVQGLAVAKWALESGSYDRSLQVLSETMKTSQALVSELLGSKPVRPGMFRRRGPAMKVGG